MVTASGQRNVLPRARIRDLHAAEVRSVVVVSWRGYWMAGRSVLALAGVTVRRAHH